MGLIHTTSDAQGSHSRPPLQVRRAHWEVEFYTGWCGREGCVSYHQWSFPPKINRTIRWSSGQNPGFYTLTEMSPNFSSALTGGVTWGKSFYLTFNLYLYNKDKKSLYQMEFLCEDWNELLHIRHVTKWVLQQVWDVTITAYCRFPSLSCLQLYLKGQAWQTGFVSWVILINWLCLPEAFGWTRSEVLF